MPFVLEHDVPVATAATVVADSCLFVALVATARLGTKGFGETATRMAIYEGGKPPG